MSDQLDSFEARLLTELRQHVTDSPSGETEQEKQTQRFAGPRLAIASAAAVLVVAAALLAPGLGSSPAYSVGEGNAGEVRVEINRPEDADGLEQALEEYGISADITYLPQLQVCEAGRYTVVDRRSSGMMTSVSEDSISVTVPPGTIRDGETLVLAWSVVPLQADDVELFGVGGGFRTTVEFDIATGPIAPCEPVDLQLD